MIKIKYKKKLNEDFLKHSASAQQDITTFVTQQVTAKKNGKKIFNVALREVIYDKPNILLGLPFLFYGNLLNGTLPSDKINKNWDNKQKQFNESFINDILNKNVKIPVSIIDDPEGKFKGTIRIGLKDSGDSLLEIVFNRAKIPNLNSINSIARHELQHITQTLNHYCILYGERLRKVKSIKSVKLIDFSGKNVKTLRFGLGRDQTGDKFHKVESDSEYENHLTDLVYALYNRLKKDKLQDEIKASGANATAVKYIKRVFDRFYATNEKEYDGFQSLLSRLLKVRPKELPKDMLKLLERLFSA
jgi:hypothetical protein